MKPNWYIPVALFYLAACGINIWSYSIYPSVVTLVVTLFITLGIWVVFYYLWSERDDSR